MLTGIKKNNIANMTMGILLLVISLNILVPELIINAPESFIHLTATTFPLMFVFGPLMYFYTLFKTNKITHLKKSDVLHVVPALICLLLVTPFLFQPASVKLDFFEQCSTEGLPTILVIGWLIECMHIITYLLLASLEILRFHKSIKTQRSNVDTVNLRWLFKLLITNELVWWAYVGIFILYLMGAGKEGFMASYYIFSYLTSGMVYVIGYAALKHPEIYQHDVKEKKYEKSGLTEQIAAQYYQDLVNFMNLNKPYQKNDLTLNQLADLLGIHPNHLSQVINEFSHKNFFDFINHYRIEAAKEMLSEPDQDNTIIEIAYAVGFNTKSTFNAAFKKNTGTTPSVFKRSHNSKVGQTAISS